MFKSVFGKKEPKKPKNKPKSKSPSIRIMPEAPKEDLERVYTDSSIKLDSKKSPSFKNSYSVDVDEKILENITLNIEYHWPDLFEDQKKKQSEEAEKRWLSEKKKKDEKSKKEEALIATEFLKNSNYTK